MRKKKKKKEFNIVAATGKIIKSFRNELGWSQEHLEELSGINSHSISNIELGKSDIRITTLYELVRVLRIPTDRIFYPDKKPDSPARQIIEVELNDCSENELKQIYRMIELVKNLRQGK